MSQTSYQTTVENERYYRAFIEQNTDCILRVDFDEPIAVNAGKENFAGNFLKLGFIAEFNKSFANDFAFAGENSTHRLADISKQTALFSRRNIYKFFDDGLKIENLEFEETNNHSKSYKTDFIGIIEAKKLVCVWIKLRDSHREKLEIQTSVEIERQWQLTQKIEALGRLAGGIAHDFNNFLAVMMLQNDMLNLQLPAGSPLRHRTEEVKKATGKAAAMVKQLLAIGRKQPLHPKPTEINQVISEFSNNLSSFVSGKIELKLNLAENLGVCFIDQNQLAQSLINLAQNANEAMPDGGILSIETLNIFLDKNSVRHKSQPEGGFVQITFSDNGTGMDSLTLESAFEPFFSTKTNAKGVGLGLATVYGFVKQSKGFIWVESELGKGTTLKIQFPRIDQPVAVE